MRELLYLFVFLVVGVLFYILYRKTRGDLFILFWAGLILLLVGSSVVKFISVNTIPEDVYSVVSEVKDIIGDSSIVRVDDNDEIEILINDKWVSTSEINILHWVTDGIVVEYDGKEIKIMDSGLTSAIKFLDRIGFLN